MANVKTLVTGCAGFIGSNFVRHALHQRPGWEILGLDKLTYAGNLENLRDVDGDPRYRFVRGDITDADLVDRLFREGRFDVAVNFAAESHVDRSILDASAFIETNVRGTHVLLEAARRYGTPRFVQVSTDEGYGSIESGAFTEASPLRPNSPYAASKAAADLLCLAYFKTYRLPVMITRSSNNYGPHQFPEKLIPLTILQTLRGQLVPVYGRGANVRDWLYVDDNCQAIALVVDRGRVGEVYNIGSGEERRNIDLVEFLVDLIADRLGKPSRDLQRLITFVKDRPGHDLRYALDTSKMAAELAWKPAVRLEQGLTRTLGWYLQNEDWLQRVVSGDYREYAARVSEQGSR